jgi:hypothetical protein
MMPPPPELIKRLELLERRVEFIEGWLLPEGFELGAVGPFVGVDVGGSVTDIGIKFLSPREDCFCTCMPGHEDECPYCNPDGQVWKDRGLK